MSTDTTGLRELKKQETRQLISDRATHLFLARGFEDTTIADIATAARVAKKTVTNYFARKEDLAFDQHEQFTQGLARTVAERASGESALAALRRSFLAAVERHDPVIGFSGQAFARMIADSPTLTARLRELHELREAALAHVLATETGADPDDDVTPRAVAAQLAAADRVLFGEVVRRTLNGEREEQIEAAVRSSTEEVFALLTPAVGTYAVHP